MKTSKLVMIAMLTAVAAFAVGCDNEDTTDGNGTDNPNNPDGGPDGGEVIDVDLSECEEFADNTCAAVIAAGEAERCVADFGYGTCQAGNPGECENYCGYDKFVGVYGYNDTTEGATQMPEPNFEASEQAWPVAFCDPMNTGATNFALHFKASGYRDWGCGIGMDWGGPLTEACKEENNPGAIDCLWVTQEDPKYTIESAMEDPRCARDDAAAADLMRECLMYGKNVKNTRDLSAYIGLGFWVLAMDDHEAAQVKVNFPIPASTRFYGNELTDGTGCTDEDGNSETQCYNDYAKYVNFNPQDKGKWVYKEVLFTDLEWSEDWGFQLDTLGYEKNNFPTQDSIGFKWQIDRNIAYEVMPETNFYLDDVILIK